MDKVSDWVHEAARFASTVLWQHPVVAFVRRALLVALTLAVLLNVIIATAVCIYSLFYYLWVPKAVHSFPVFLDYRSHCPSTIQPLSDDGVSRLFSRNQGYDFYVELAVPESEVNEAAGMFMVTLVLASDEAAAARALREDWLAAHGGLRLTDTGASPSPPRMDPLVGSRDDKRGEEQEEGEGEDEREVAKQRAQAGLGAATISHATTVFRPSAQRHRLAVKLGLVQGASSIAISRPVRLQYRSLLFRVLRTATLYLPLLFGVAEETQRIHVPLFEDVPDDPTNSYRWMGLALSQPDLQITEARLMVYARMKGITYWMYHWFFSTFVIGVYTTSVLLALITLLVYCWCCHRPRRALPMPGGPEGPPAPFPRLGDELRWDDDADDATSDAERRATLQATLAGDTELVYDPDQDLYVFPPVRVRPPVASQAGRVGPGTGAAPQLAAQEAVFMTGEGTGEGEAGVDDGREEGAGGGDGDGDGDGEELGRSDTRRRPGRLAADDMVAPAQELGGEGGRAGDDEADGEYGDGEDEDEDEEEAADAAAVDVIELESGPASEVVVVHTTAGLRHRFMAADTEQE